MDEFELIRRYFARCGDARGVVEGIGDDGAVLQPDPGLDLVAVTDTLVENVHFPQDIDAADLGYRVVAVNLSDIAAMGARPRWMTLALTLSSANADWLEGFARGLFEAADEYGLVLVGGDVTHGGAVVATVQVIGDVPAGKAMLRSGAQQDDTIYVTGTVGDAAAGLALWQCGTPGEFLTQRYLRPTARVNFGRRVADFATAAIDISDGLYGDLAKLLDASGVGGEINLDALPLSAPLQAMFAPDEQRRFALSGGDDYELCFTSSRGAGPAGDDLCVTAIGKVTGGSGLVCRSRGEIVEYADPGYRHFA